MSHHVHPKIFRLRDAEDWLSRGYYGKNPADLLEEDFKIRRFLTRELKLANVEKIEIERSPARINIIILTSRPGFIIGRGGEGIERLRQGLEKQLSKKKAIKIEVQAVRNPWASAAIVAQWASQRIEKRVPFRRVLKETLSKIMVQKGIEGAKIKISGRLNGTEMARTEWLKQGKLPRQTIRSDLDYGFTEALCTYGKIGIKVWIYKGEKL